MLQTRRRHIGRRLVLQDPAIGGLCRIEDYIIGMIFREADSRESPINFIVVNKRQAIGEHTRARGEFNQFVFPTAVRTAGCYSELVCSVQGVAVGDNSEDMAR